MTQPGPNQGSPQPGQPQNFQQQNAPGAGGTVYANQGTGNQNVTTNYNLPKMGRYGGRALLIILVVDVAFFIYGATAYTGRGTTADNWRAGIFFVLVIVTVRMIRSWLRRRF